MKEVKNFGFSHKAGVIMPVFSLPSRYGIGSFGKSAYDFVDFLEQTGQTCWQVLPLNPTSYGDSPYQSPASAAGNPYFIDLDLLARDRLLTKAEVAAHRTDGARVDYGHLFNTRYKLLRLAHSRFRPTEEYRLFLGENQPWLDDYALFMALKVQYGFCSWTKWAPEHRDHGQAVQYREEYAREMEFWRWCQFAFFTQWKALVSYAHEKGIVIIGDMPIYVAHDSVDVWAAPEQFLLDESFHPIVVAGCPPDGFSPDGQLWGNPIYNWKLMEEEGFRWWLDRIGAVFGLYDILRIDHFRGFAGYYSVPYGEATARNGKWSPAPGIQLFRTIRQTYPQCKLIAEDLGFITEDVRELLEDAGLPGMKMLHFAFYDRNSENLPRMYESDNCVVYSASHDSDCSYTWCKNLSGTARRRFNRECPRHKGQHRVYDLIRMAFESRANLAMVPLQDYLMLSNEEGRMNEPSTAAGNWTWRVSPRYNTPKLRAKILSVTQVTNRDR